MFEDDLGSVYLRKKLEVEINAIQGHAFGVGEDGREVGKDRNVTQEFLKKS